MTVMTTTVTTLLRRLAGPVQALPEAGPTDLVLRFAGPADTAAIDRLAQLDSRRAPRGAVLLAEVEGTPGPPCPSTTATPSRTRSARPASSSPCCSSARARSSARAPTAAIERVWPKAGYDHPAWS